MPDPRTTANLTLSLPLAVEQNLRALANTQGLPISAVAGDLLEAGREAPRRISELKARIASLEAELKTRPPPDFQDSILKRAPGTSRLLRQRDDARAKCRELEDHLTVLEAEARKWEDSSAAWEEACADLERSLGDVERERDRHVIALKRQETALAAKEADLQRQSAAHRVQLQRQAILAFWKGLGAAVPLVALLAGLLLVTVPHDSRAMRFVAATAMGKTFSPEKAAVRLHGLPLAGVGTQLQPYALAHSGPNRERLADCFMHASAIPAKAKHQTVDCTIMIPSELEVQSILLLEGPFELPRGMRKNLRRSDKASIATQTSDQEPG